MPLFWADPAPSRSTDRIHPALTSFADEVCATVARIFAYVGTLALIAVLGIHAWDQVDTGEPTAKAGWSAADPSNPGFNISKQDQGEKSVTYTALRHPAGARRDILRSASGGIIKPAAGLGTAEGTADWLSSTENPQLRGTL